ncbi:MAG: ATP-dependent protease ATPase subunit HslU [Thermogutta sp.]|nr:ATP-dependent protease ATPase subunit HslU [Thermogutta sp.]
MPSLTPHEIVAELDKYIIGQSAAKRAVAVAIRNRYRRQQLPPEMRSEVAPKNILMVGPTGVGKTEIARRLARLTGAPFVKVEATKFTEVGYVGRDVESMIRELVENAIFLVRSQELEKVREEAERKAEKRLVQILLQQSDDSDDSEEQAAVAASPRQRREKARARMAKLLRGGVLDDRPVEIEVEKKQAPLFFGGPGGEQFDLDLQSMFGKLLSSRNTQRREVTVAQAKEILAAQEAEALIDEDKVHSLAVESAENAGIVFLDEIDKITAGGHGTEGPDVSREGVQRDLLPVVEGTTVQTRYGQVRTDHILFIAAGAFHRSKPSDLMPELQGRFPIRVELDELSKEDFLRILTEPKNSLIKQYQALLATEGVELIFAEGAVEAVAESAFYVNQTTQNIGARRLYTVMERLLEEISFDVPDKLTGKVTIDRPFVQSRLSEIIKDEDLSRFIL